MQLTPLFPTSQGSTLYLCFIMGSLSSGSSFSSVPSHLRFTRMFPFLSATNLTKLERHLWLLSSSPIPLPFSEASLPPLRVTLTHFTLFSYERALRLPTSFPILGLARLGVKPRLFRSSWRAFASTHPLVLPSTSSREALLACPPCPPWNLPSFTVESPLSTPCSRSDPPSRPP